VIGRRRTPDASARRVGVEHEYQLVGRAGIVDARALWPTIRLDGARLDPGDANAVRCRWGGVVTTDGQEAEVATPPCRLGAGGVELASRFADVGAAALRAALPDAVSMRGYSTHLNVEADDRRARQVARSIADRMAPAVMLLLDRADSPGLLVRPRHRRVELGGEFQRGDTLVAALTLSAGAVLAAERAARRGSRTRLPPRLALRIVPSPQRHGWYVDRRAGGDDLYEHGRAARLRTEAGRTRRGQDVLEPTWSLARPLVADHVSAPALAIVDRVVGGERPLPCELPDFGDPGPPVVATPPAPGASLLDPRRRGAITITTVAATWRAVTLRAESAGAVRWINVPAEHIDGFLAALDAGALDRWLHRRVGGRPKRTAA
jgi:hypothetical protein